MEGRRKGHSKTASRTRPQKAVETTRNETETSEINRHTGDGTNTAGVGPKLQKSGQRLTNEKDGNELAETLSGDHPRLMPSLTYAA